MLRIESFEIEAVKLITPNLRRDERGFFTRLYCKETLAQSGINFTTVQMNLSGNHEAYTFRGLHYQVAPAAEAKLVRCSAGRILDIAVDARPDSPTYLQYVTAELSAETKNTLYIPPMFAHGYLTLTPGAEVTYATSALYSPSYERGLRHDDPAIGLKLSYPIKVISEKDRHWPLLASDSVSR